MSQLSSNQQQKFHVNTSMDEWTNGPYENSTDCGWLLSQWTQTGWSDVRTKFLKVKILNIVGFQRQGELQKRHRGMLQGEKDRCMQ